MEDLKRGEVTIDYDMDPQHGLIVKFKIDGMTKLSLPIKVLRIAVEEGDKKVEELKEKQRVSWLHNQIKVLGKKK